jgi:hypothetical protein
MSPIQNKNVVLVSLNCTLYAGLGSGVTEDEFRQALYSFDIGQNDISLAFTANLTQERILQTVVPAIATRIRNAVKVTLAAATHCTPKFGFASVRMRMSCCSSVA